MRLDPSTSLLAVIDVQERLLPVIPAADRLVARVARLAEAARPIERWIGEYPSASLPAFIASPSPDVRLAMVTSGTGMSTAFALAEETMADLLGLPIPEAAE